MKDMEYLEHLKRNIYAGAFLSLISLAIIIYISNNNIALVYLAPAVVALLSSFSFMFVSKMNHVRVRAYIKKIN